jgi:hypothetical protein
VFSALDASRGHHTRAHDPPLAVHVPDEQLKGPHALGEARGQHLPFRGVDHPWDRVDAKALCATGRLERDAALARVARDRFAELPQVSAADRLPDLTVVLRGVHATGDSLLEGAAQLCRCHPLILYPPARPVIRPASKKALCELDAPKRRRNGSIVPAFPYVERMSIFRSIRTDFAGVVRKGLHEVARYGQPRRQMVPDRGNLEV